MAGHIMQCSWLRFLIIVVSICFGLIGCEGSQSNIPLRETEVAQLPTVEPTQQNTPTRRPLPSATPSTTPTQTQAPTVTATMMPIATPEPTVPQALPSATVMLTIDPLATQSQQRPIATMAAPLVTITTVEAATPTNAPTITATVTATELVEEVEVIEAVADDAAETDTASLTVSSAPVEPSPTVVIEPVVASAESIEKAGFTNSMTGTFDEMDALFKQVEREVNRYATSIDNLSPQDCWELNAIYERIIASPEFTPPAYRRQAYISYLTSVNSLRGGGRKVADFCSDYIASVEDATLTEEAVTAVNIGTSKSDYFIDQARLQLQVFPVKATFLGSRPSNLPGFWEIDLSFTLNEGEPPYTAQVGGFLRQEGNRITILHTCLRDFLDHVSVTDAENQFFRSDKVEAPRLDHCN